MNEFRKSFRNVASQFVSEFCDRNPVFELNDEKDVLTFPAKNESGFEFKLECFDYGVYPSAKGWFSGCWDVTVIQPNDLATSLSEFLYSLLNDAVLIIFYSGEMPYKWKMNLQFEGERIDDIYRVHFYNWFGRKQTKEYCNGETPNKEFNSHRLKAVG